MGTFFGHALPGTFFLGFALWWTWATFHRYFFCILQRSSNGVKKREYIEYRNTSSTQCFCCGKERPIESMLKVIAASIGILGEFCTAFDNHEFAHIGNAQHISMFFFFGLQGAVEIFQYKQLPIPPDLEYVSAILALMMEGLLFYYHLHGRKHMDIQMHMFIFYVVMVSIVAISFEMRFRNNVLPALGRIYCTLLQGTWFYQVAFVLYPINHNSNWDADNHQQMMIITVIFAWHNAGIFIFLILAGFFCYRRVKRMLGKSSYYPIPMSQSCNEVDCYEEKIIHIDQTKKFIIQSDEEEMC